MKHKYIFLAVMAIFLMSFGVALVGSFPNTGAYRLTVDELQNNEVFINHLGDGVVSDDSLALALTGGASNWSTANNTATGSYFQDGNGFNLQAGNYSDLKFLATNDSYFGSRAGRNKTIYWGTQEEGNDTQLKIASNRTSATIEPAQIGDVLTVFGFGVDDFGNRCAFMDLAPASGGGSIYTEDGTLTEDREVNISDASLTFQTNDDALFYIGSDNVLLRGSDVIVDANMTIAGNSNNNGTSSFNGPINWTHAYPTGTSSDKIIVIDPTSREVKTIDQSTIGGGSGGSSLYTGSDNVPNGVIATLDGDFSFRDATGSVVFEHSPNFDKIFIGDPNSPNRVNINKPEVSELKFLNTLSNVPNATEVLTLDANGFVGQVTVDTDSSNELQTLSDVAGNVTLSQTNSEVFVGGSGTHTWSTVSPTSTICGNQNYTVQNKKHKWSRFKNMVNLSGYFDVDITSTGTCGIAYNPEYNHFDNVANVISLKIGDGFTSFETVVGSVTLVNVNDLSAKVYSGYVTVVVSNATKTGMNFVTENNNGLSIPAGTYKMYYDIDYSTVDNAN